MSKKDYDFHKYIKIGKCNLCDGSVLVQRSWSGVIPPPKICSSCGAQEVSKDGEREMSHFRSEFNGNGSGNMDIQDNG